MWGKGGLSGILQLRGVNGQTVIHVSLEPGPLRHPLDGAFLSGEDASDLLQLLLVPLQIVEALALQQAELLLPVLVHGDVFAHVGIEAEISVGREEGVKHGVNLWWWERKKHDILHTGQAKNHKNPNSTSVYKHSQVVLRVEKARRAVSAVTARYRVNIHWGNTEGKCLACLSWLFSQAYIW